MGKIKSAIDKVSGTETSSRTAGDAILKMSGTMAADEVTVDTKITIGETALTEEQLIALLALLN